MTGDFETPHLVDPVIRGMFRELVEEEFGAQPHVADDIAFRVLLAMKRKKLRVIKERIYVMPMTQEERWLQITKDAVEWINGPASPLNRSELR